MKNFIQSALDHLGSNRQLPTGLIQSVMHQIMDGKATDAQIGGLLMGLKIRGETIQNITEAVQAMRERAIKVDISPDHLIDTCGTGGDGKSLFNVSTACAFVAAAAGCRVAKHGNRSVSSSTGSADLLEAAGINLNITPAQVKHCINACGIGFLFAPAHHGATRHAIKPRKELAVRTIFNLIGPLTNPANTPYQVMGIYTPEYLLTVAKVLKQLGSKHVMVIHSEDGMDEISLSAPTKIAELKDNKIKQYSLQPEEFGIEKNDMSQLIVSNAQESLKIIKTTLSGQAGPAANMIALNAGAAIYVAQKTDSMHQGVKTAQTILKNGLAMDKLIELKQLTQGFKND